MLNNLHTQRANLHKEHQEIIFALQSQKYTAEICDCLCLVRTKI